MRKFILSLTLFSALTASAQCGELFISEYVEGSRNNKALEIYNPTWSTIDLTQYRITRWQNGTAVWNRQYSDTLYGSIGNNEVKVLVLDRRDTTKTDQDTPVTRVLRVKADIWLSPVYTRSFGMSFNGDDALSLDKYDPVSKIWKPVDVFGKIGEQPQLPSNPNRTIGWSDSFPFNRGLGMWWTIDHTMIRKRTVTQGVNTNPNFFDPRKEWTLYPVNMFDSLRTHHCDCNQFPAKVRRQENTFSIYPNPADDQIFGFINGRATSAWFSDISGRRYEAVPDMQYPNGFAVLRVSTSMLSAGMYTLHVILEDGSTLNARVIKP